MTSQCIARVYRILQPYASNERSQYSVGVHRAYTRTSRRRSMYRQIRSTPDNLHRVRDHHCRHHNSRSSPKYRDVCRRTGHTWSRGIWSSCRRCCLPHRDFLSDLATMGCRHSAKLLLVSRRLRPRQTVTDKISVGALVAAGVTLGTGQWNSTWAWRAPSFFQAIWAILCIVVLPFM